MGDGSKIEWTEATWNPVTGCSKVSPGCAHCYAEAVTARYAGSPGWIAEHRPWTPENAEHNLTVWPERLDQPLRWRRPRMVFVNSMSDLFHELLPEEFIADVFAVMAIAKQHTFQVLTKRPDRMRDVLNDECWPLLLSAALQKRGAEPIPNLFEDDRVSVLPNVWLGTSIENRQFTQRADALRAAPAAVRFISAEPLLGSLIAPPCDRNWYGECKGWVENDGCRSCPRTQRQAGKSAVRREPTPSLDLTAIDWLIVGGESGKGHRPMRVEWARDLRDAAARAGTAFFFKQWGGHTPTAGGRVLDGRLHDAMPEGASS